MLHEILQKLTGHDADQAQREALIDLLNLLCHIDNKIKLAEQQYIDRFLESLDWDSGLSKESYLSNSISKIRAALEGDGDPQPLIEDIGKHLTTASFRNLALDLAQSFSVTDRELDPKETAVIEALRKILA